MRYQKGDFTIVPNKSALIGLSATTQAVYMWMCSFTDDTGYCYPSRQTLADNCGVGINTLDKHLKKLSAVGIIKIESRYRDDGGQTSNGYWIILKDVAPTQGQKLTPTPVSKSDTQTIPILTIPIISSEEEIQPKVVPPKNDLIKRAKEIKQTREKKSPLFRNPPSTINREAWFRWVSHATQLSRLTDSATRMQWERLATFSMQSQADMIDYSISQNYRGLFDVDNKKTGSKSIDLT